MSLWLVWSTFDLQFLAWLRRMHFLTTTWKIFVYCSSQKSDRCILCSAQQARHSNKQAEASLRHGQPYWARFAVTSAAQWSWLRSSCHHSHLAVPTRPFDLLGQSDFASPMKHWYQSQESPHQSHSELSWSAKELARSYSVDCRLSMKLCFSWWRCYSCSLSPAALLQSHSVAS